MTQEIESSDLDFFSLSVGDVVEAPGLMAPVTDTPTVFTVTAKTDTDVTLAVTYHNLPVATVTLAKTEGGQQWQLQ